MKKLKQILAIIAIVSVVLGMTAVKSPTFTVNNNAASYSNKGAVSDIIVRK